MVDRRRWKSRASGSTDSDQKEEEEEEEEWGESEMSKERRRKRKNTGSRMTKKKRNGIELDWKVLKNKGYDGESTTIRHGLRIGRVSPLLFMGCELHEGTHYLNKQQKAITDLLFAEECSEIDRSQL